MEEVRRQARENWVRFRQLKMGSAKEASREHEIDDDLGL
jgi:hypothetical protein